MRITNNNRILKYPSSSQVHEHSRRSGSGRIVVCMIQSMQCVFFVFVCVCCHNWESLHRDNLPKPPVQIISKSLYFMHPMNQLIQRSSTNPPLKSIGPAECHFPYVLPCKKKWATKLSAICSLSRLAPRHADLLEYRLITWSFKQLINRYVYSVQHVYTVYM